jgi:hypothetical protein
MAKVKLTAGAEVDLLSPKEHEAHLGHLEKAMREMAGTVDTQSAVPFSTDATGGTATLSAGGGVVYHVPAGYHAYMTRLSVDYEGSTAKTPVSCDLRVCADQVTPAALRSIAAMVPNVFSESRSHAPLFRPGQQIVVALQSGPATTMLYCTVQVLLVSTMRALHFDIEMDH